MARVSVKELLKAGVHYGHPTSRWNPKMERFIFGKRKRIHIINLRWTVRGIVQGRKFLYEIAARGEPILFVGTKRQAAAVVRQEVGQRGFPYVADRWLGGMLTNFQTVRRSLGRLEELERLEQTGEIYSHSKKMISMLLREKRKILRNLQGVRTLDRVPAVVVIIDPRRDRIAIREAVKLGIPAVALIDTDSDPSLVDIPIPCNDDSIRSIQLILRQLLDAAEEGRAAWEAGRAAPEAAPPPAAPAGPAPAGESAEPTPASTPVAPPPPVAAPSGADEGSAPAEPQA